ncbi:MAG: tRNA epoxyqueuosine(34) reductase QueG [Bacteroidota bacterium]|nr:tRNA epoxyqueuosine(34) reductase QueG [Bacteroidota bacterium]
MSFSPEHSAKIKAAALKLGFDDAGITDAKIPEEDIARYNAWLENGYHAKMSYMKSRYDMRLDPQKLFPGVRSVIVLLQAYYNEDLPGYPYKIARYAVGKDYHKRLKKRLKKLQASIQEITGKSFVSRPFVDSAPVLERSLAVKAGLGWIGKNTCLIHPKLGSYVFIAELFTDLDLVPDTNHVKNRCGTCTRCINACPAQALSKNGLDARRCISYHTIETRTAIPRTVAEGMQKWVFGCDICQEVCPWNRNINARVDTDFLPAKHINYINIDILKSMNDKQFRQIFAGTAFLRAGRIKLLKNIEAVKTGGSQ